MPDDNSPNPASPGGLTDSQAMAALMEEPERDTTPPGDDQQEAPESDQPEPETAAEDAPAPADEDVEATGEDEDAESEDDKPEPTYAVKIRGKVRQIGLSELIAGYSRQSDYQRKTQELADQRRELDGTRQQVEQERQWLSQRYSEISAQHGNQEPDWVALAKLAQDDPAEAQRIQAQWFAQAQQRQYLQAQAQQMRQYQHQQFVAQEEQKLMELVPEWAADPTRFEAEAPALQKFALSLGLSQEQLPHINAQSWAAMRDAKKWRDHVAAQKKAAQTAPAKKVLPKPPVVQRPGAVQTRTEKNSEQLAALQQQARRSGSEKDALALLERIL